MTAGEEMLDDGAAGAGVGPDAGSRLPITMSASRHRSGMQGPLDPIRCGPIY